MNNKYSYAIDSIIILTLMLLCFFKHITIVEASALMLLNSINSQLVTIKNKIK